MDKNLVIKARTHFGKNPIRIVCDNMIIAYDNTPNAVNLIWHDDEEYLERITPTQSDNLVGSGGAGHGGTGGPCGAGGQMVAGGCAGGGRAAAVGAGPYGEIV